MWGNENAGKRKSQSGVATQPQKKQDVTAKPNKVPSHMANIDKNNGRVYVIRVNKKSELLGQSVL